MTDDATDKPAPDPRDAELEALRKEKAEREQAARDAQAAELEELRQFKTAQEKEAADRAAKAVKPPAKRNEPPAVATPESPAAKKRRGLWWPDR